MMTPEQKFYYLIKDHIPGHVNRIENSTGVGIPDVNFCFKGVETWLELKANIGLKFERVGDHIRNKYSIPHGKIRDSQLIWHSQRVKQGGRVLVATRDKDTITIMTCSSYELYMVILSQSKPWDWDKIEACLRGDK